MKRKIRNMAFFGLLMISLVLVVVAATIALAQGGPAVLIVPLGVGIMLVGFGKGLALLGQAGFAALTADRDTPERTGARFELGAAATKKFYAGALVMRSATGYATPGATATGCIGLGRVAEYVDNTSGADDAVKVKIDRGIYRFGNSAAGDAITNADIGTLCFIVDDQTVAKTDGGATRSTAGRVVEVDSSGVWVEFLHMASVAAGVGTAELDNDAVTNDKLANIARGSVKVGGVANAPTDLDAKGDGKILVGDGTDVKSVAVSGDALLTNAGVVTVKAAKAVADPGTGVAIPVTGNASVAITTGAAGETNTLAIPSFVGQILSLTLDVDGGGDRVITVAAAINQAGNTVITMNDAGDNIVLIGCQVGGALVWRVLQNDGCTLA